MPDRRSRRHQATRQEILDAAWQLSRDKGLTGWSLREVAAAVDMRAPSLYVYFDGKDAIYDAMFAQGYHQLIALGDVAGAGAPAQIMRRTAQAFFDFCVADPVRHQLLFLPSIPGFTPSPDSYALAVQALDQLRAEMATAGITSERAIDLWTAIITGLVSQQLSNDPGGDRWARLIDGAVDMFLAAELQDRRAGDAHVAGGVGA